ncbi:RidA family protein [Sphingosinicella microcystinivorans]|uniref:Enamine deaminase RidA n=1 Tax=Sphingosinicella microcystinivorans TaxID=335406 RepID=A0AAD1D4N1_SPHMI|nr:RidA family protein [Sphingosinicella microcystinivorans]RKS85437.1 enamine deaminase RidA (YjgF/YER057c/UK114 family) [Sphingosinicella microcystinivorans]BBE33273.1 enamine deaminase RidA [Sphingosinicella microcystinivorans]
MRRKSIDIDGYRHIGAPIPVASRIDNIVYTGAISGFDLDKGEHVEGLEAQAELMFTHLKAVLEAAGATPEDVVRMTFYVKTPEARKAINAEWVKLFPDEASRPARHILNYETPRASQMQCDAVAVLPREGRGS